jgi:AcrR family transcriptional regulator
VGITTRRLAEEAEVNHGLIHYYFGSNENLMLWMLGRRGAAVDIDPHEEAAA